MAGPRSSKHKQEVPQELRRDWTKVGRLGEGGQGFVLELEHKQTGERRAVKCLGRGSAYRKARLVREIEVLRQINHLNVISIIDHAQDHSWYTMPVGEPLTGYWKKFRGGTGSAGDLFDQSFQLIAGTLDGLAAAHGLGLVHRDIKPSNILLLDGVPKLADFGIVHVPEAERLTEEPAANKFAPHAPSLYDPTVAPKRTDCFGVAALWAWLLASDPSTAYGHYHWRWHNFIEDRRCEIARAALAICSDDTSAPADAVELSRFLIRELGLRSNAAAVPSDQIGKRIAETQSVAKAGEVQTKVETKVLASSLAMSISSFVDAISNHCIALAERLQAQGAEMHVRRPGEVFEWKNEIKPTPLSELVEAAAAAPGKDIPVLTLSPHEDPSDLSMTASILVHWHSYPHEDGSKLSLGLRLTHRIPELRRLTYFKVQRAGAVLDEEWTNEIGPATINQRIDSFLLNPDHYAS